MASGGEAAIWADVPNVVLACGAFPVRVGEEWVATVAVSGLAGGPDHELVLRALEGALGLAAPRRDAAVA